MSDNVPGVLISSTFYDLKQIRADLADFIELELGYRPLISEGPPFPIDPDVDTIENCRRRVAQDADILVLVVGSRYGSIDMDTSKSITNIEYLAARAKGIPIYACVEKRTLTLLEVWEKAGPAALAGIVDDVRLFEFVRQVRSVDKVWVSGFEAAQEIVRNIEDAARLFDRRWSLDEMAPRKVRTLRRAEWPIRSSVQDRAGEAAGMGGTTIRAGSHG